MNAFCVDSDEELSGIDLIVTVDELLVEVGIAENASTPAASFSFSPKLEIASSPTTEGVCCFVRSG